MRFRIVEGLLNLLKIKSILSLVCAALLIYCTVTGKIEGKDALVIIMAVFTYYFNKVISTKTILFNGEPLDVEMSTVNDTNYIKLRDLEKLNVGLTISYNASKKMPEIKTKK